jgi:ribosomal protein S18 acetylase RimI-like enzyme
MGVKRLARIAGRMLWRPGLIIQWLRERGSGASVQYDGGRVSAVLTTIAVEPGLKTRGVGRKLVGDLEQFFARSAVTIYWVETLVENGAARAFYGRLGFEETGTRAGNVILVKRVHP